MKKMTKLGALLLALAMMFALASCGSNGAASSKGGASSAPAADGSASGSEAGSASGADASAADDAAESDLQYVKDKGTLVVGITDFEPMDYKDDSGEWVGFDADLARAFAESLGVQVEFVEINWDNKILELGNKSIDCVWNGMTLTDEVTSSMECSNAYMNNTQVVVVPTAKDADADNIDELKNSFAFAVESGSAGEAQAQKYEFNYTPVESQANALMEVAAGTSDAAIIDSLMAGAMVGEGTGYPDLTYTISLNEDEGEQYGVGFRKGSDLAAALNDFFVNFYNNMEQIAETYGVQAALIEQ